MRKQSKAAEVQTGTIEPANEATDKSRVPQGAVSAVGRIVGHAQRLQQPMVAKYVASLRTKHPDDTPEQLIRRLEKRYLNAVTGTGAAVGAAAAIPGVGTVTALTAITAETAAFIEASALLALATAEVHGISPEDAELRRTLVLSVALGEEGVAALGKVVGVRSTEAVSKLGVPGLETASLARLNKALTSKLVKKLAIGRAPIVVGKLIPGGIGAVIGGAGNRALGSMVLRNARTAFGAPPRFWDIDGAILPSGRDAAGPAALASTSAVPGRLS